MGKGTYQIQKSVIMHNGKYHHIKIQFVIYFREHPDSASDWDDLRQEIHDRYS